MKKSIVKTTLLTLCVAAILVAPAISRAQDTTTNAPAASEPAPKKHGAPFHGTLTAADTNAMTIAVGDLTLQVTSTTKITKDGAPATLADGVVGQPVSGAYKKSDDGKRTATTIHFGKAKKKKADAAAQTGNGQN